MVGQSQSMIRELRKPIGFLSLSILVVLAIIGSERATDRQTVPGRVVVTYWEKWNGDEMKAMLQLVNAFNQSQDKIQVQYLSISGIQDKTLLATAGGNPPDIAGLWGDQVSQYADADALEDLTDLAAQAGITEGQYIKSYWQEMTYHGRIYAMPSSPGTSALYVNADLMPPQYNSPEKFPKTLSEFNKFVEVVSKFNPDHTLKTAAFLPRDGFGTGSWPYLFGGSFYKDGKIDVNSPIDVQAWTWVNSFAKRFGVRETQSFRSGFGNYSSPQNPFLCGKLATYLDGPWFSNYIRLFNPKIHWFAVPIPYPDGHPELKDFTVLNLNTLVIPKGAKHVKEAFAFLAFVQQQKNMEDLCLAQQCNSPLAKVSQHFLQTHKNKFISLFDFLARSPRAFGPVPIGINNQISSEIGNAADLMDLGKLSPQAALDTAQARLSEAWTKYRVQVLRQPSNALEGNPGAASALSQAGSTK